MPEQSVVTASRNRRRPPRRRPRGYAPWKPTPDVLERLEQVEQVLAEYNEHVPLTVRQIFYRLVAQFGYPKDERAYSNLGYLLGRARRSQRISFDVIRDDGIVVQAAEFYEGVEDFHNETGRRAKRYRRDRQAGQDQYIELWCEAQGMLGQLARVARPYSIPVYSCGGFNSLTATHRIAERALGRDVPTVLLHVGDWDKAGEDIFASMAEDAAAFVEEDRSIWPQEIQAERVALTPAQVKKYELPAVLKGTRQTCQLEALSPSLLASVVESAINEYVDRFVLEEVEGEENGDRAELLGLPRPQGEDE